MSFVAERENYKCVIVGDGAVGKTCMLVSYTDNTFPEEFIPTVFDTYSANLIVDGRSLTLSLWDTAGQEDFEKLRPLSYSDTDVFIICYSICLRSSFENVKVKWIPELGIYEPDSPFIVVGTKVDTRSENKDPEKEDSFVSTSEIKQLVDDTDAYGFVECSALQQVNLQEVFDEACRCVFNLQKKLEDQKKGANKKDKRKSTRRDDQSQSGSQPVDSCCVLV